MIISYGNYLQNKAKIELDKNFLIAPWTAWVAIVVNSLQSGGSAVLMRKMKDIHWITLNIYLNIMFIGGSGLFVLYKGVKFNQNFDFISWLLVIIISWTEISNKSFRLMAFRYQNPGVLAPYVYLYSLYGLAYDLFIFHLSFNDTTWAGITIVLFAFSFHV